MIKVSDMKKPNVSFHEWQNELNAQLTKTKQALTIDPEAAREYYDDGYTPAECIASIADNERPRESEE